jgi:protein-tyrosine phosphatase
MQSEGIARVVCLLTDSQLGHYREDLLQEYCAAFGAANVLSAPIQDFELSSPEDLRLILGFLRESDARRQKVVVHCAGGVGRTGHVLAAWLASARGLAPRDAIEAVERAQPPRYPREAARAGNATEEQLLALLRAVSSTAD